MDAGNTKTVNKLFLVVLVPILIKRTKSIINPIDFLVVFLGFSREKRQYRFLSAETNKITPFESFIKCSEKLLFPLVHRFH